MEQPHVFLLQRGSGGATTYISALAAVSRDETGLATPAEIFEDRGFLVQAPIVIGQQLLDDFLGIVIEIVALNLVNVARGHALLFLISCCTIKLVPVAHESEHLLPLRRVRDR